MKIYELELVLKWRKDHKNVEEAKKEMMDWIQEELTENSFSWRIQLKSVHTILEKINE